MYTKDCRRTGSGIAFWWADSEMLVGEVVRLVGSISVYVEML